MLSEKEKKAIERVEDFLSSNVIISISSDESANSEELKVFISKNEYLAIEFISSMFLKQCNELEELKDKFSDKKIRDTVIKRYREVIEKDYISKDKIKAKIEELKQKKYILSSRESEIEILQSLLEKE